MIAGYAVALDGQRIGFLDRQALHAPLGARWWRSRVGYRLDGQRQGTHRRREARILPRGVPPVRLLVHAQPDAHHGFVQRQARRAQLLGKRQGEAAIGAVERGGHLARRHGRGDEQPRAGIDDADAGTHRLADRDPGVLGRDVEQQQADLARHRAERAGKVGKPEAGDGHVGFAVDGRVGRHEIAVAVVLQAEPGNIDEHHGVRSGLTGERNEIGDGGAQLRLRQVCPLGGREAEVAQRLGDEPGIVQRIRQGARLVAADAEHQGEACLLLLPRARRYGRCHGGTRGLLRRVRRPVDCGERVAALAVLLVARAAGPLVDEARGRLGRGLALAAQAFLELTDGRLRLGFAFARPAGRVLAGLGAGGEPALLALEGFRLAGRGVAGALFALLLGARGGLFGALALARPPGVGDPRPFGCLAGFPDAPFHVLLHGGELLLQLLQPRILLGERRRARLAARLPFARVGLIRRRAIHHVEPQPGIRGVNAQRIVAQERRDLLARPLADALPDLAVGLALVEHELAAARGGEFRHLAACRRLGHGIGDPGQHVRDFQPRLAGLGDEGLRERAVAAGAVGRDIVRLGRIDDDHAADLLVGEAEIEHGAACRGPALQPLGHWIVAAGVDDHDLEAGDAGERVARSVEPDHLEPDRNVVLDLGVDGHQEIASLALDAVAGIIEQRRIGILRRPGETREGHVHAALVDVELELHLEAELAQQGGDVLGIVARIGERRRARIIGIADDQRHAPLGEGRRRGPADRCGQQEKTKGCADNPQHLPATPDRGRCVTKDYTEDECSTIGKAT